MPQDSTLEPAKPFRPWAGQLRLALVFSVIGPIALALGWNRWLALEIFGGLTLAIGLSALSHVAVRVNGKRIEKQAIRSIRLPKGWVAQPNVPLLSGGDLDLQIEAPDGSLFAVEIKSHRGVKWQKGFLGLRSERLTRLNGRPLDRKPVGQVERAASEIGGVPVLWFPRAPWTLMFSGQHRFTMKCGVIVVQGGEKVLRRAIGASGKWGL